MGYFKEHSCGAVETNENVEREARLKLKIRELEDRLADFGIVRDHTCPESLFESFERPVYSDSDRDDLRFSLPEDIGAENGLFEGCTEEDRKRWDSRISDVVTAIALAERELSALIAGAETEKEPEPVVAGQLEFVFADNNEISLNYSYAA